MHQQQTPSLSDRAMDELYVAQYLALASMEATHRDVTRITIGRPAAPPDDMVVSVVSASAFVVKRLSFVLTAVWGTGLGPTRDLNHVHICLP